jgi:hypothetical protein
MSGSRALPLSCLSNFGVLNGPIFFCALHDSGCSRAIAGRSDMKEIVTLLRQIKDKAHKDGQKKTEQALSR